MAAGSTKTQRPRLTLYFIVEPPTYQFIACYLAASIREQFGPDVAMIGYCPEHRRAEVDPSVIEVLRRMQTEVRTFKVQGRFDPDYPHGNKILATLEPRETEFSGFMDSDILCIRKNDPDNVIREGHVSLTPAASMNWAKQTIWNEVYRTCGLPMPEERIFLMRQKRGKKRVPYFSSGFFTFPEQHRSADGRSFPEVWMDVAQALDRNPEIPKKRPYLDQISLPLAIRAAGLDWNMLPQEQHFILGGRMRGEPLPDDKKIFTVHYRQWPILKEVGLSGLGKRLLDKHAGVRRVTNALAGGG